MRRRTGLVSLSIARWLQQQGSLGLMDAKRISQAQEFSNHGQARWLGKRRSVGLFERALDCQSKLFETVLDLGQGTTRALVLPHIADRPRPVATVRPETALNFAGGARGLVLRQLFGRHRRAARRVATRHARGAHAPGEDGVGLGRDKERAANRALSKAAIVIAWRRRQLVRAASTEAAVAVSATATDGFVQILETNIAAKDTVASLLLLSQVLIFLRQGQWSKLGHWDQEKQSGSIVRVVHLLESLLPVEKSNKPAPTNFTLAIFLLRTAHATETKKMHRTVGS